MPVGSIHAYLRSNLLGLVAILIAPSGMVIAANTASRNSVTSKSIKNETLKGVDVRDGAPPAATSATTR